MRVALAALLVLCTMATVRAAANEPGGERLVVRFVDARGAAVESAVVMLRALDRTTKGAVAAASTTPAVMDQIDLRFAPAMLVVPVGTPVSFPNSDSVSHQVYSFSSAKRFQLPLYRGKPYAPVVFDVPGIVTIGCNIHDDMLAHIVVTDALHYGLTQADGTFRIARLEPGSYELTVWHPRVHATPDAALRRRVEIAAPRAGEGAVELQLRAEAALRSVSAPTKRPGWDGY